MAGAPFPLGAFREALIKSTGEAHKELASLEERTTQHVKEVLESIRAYARNAQNGFAVPKTPAAPKTRPRVNARKASTGSTSGQRQATRSTAKAAKRSSAKRVSSLAPSEDPEKENAGAVPPRASTRTRGKRGVAAAKLEAVAPAEKTPARATRQRQPLQAQHLTRSQAKALEANSTPCTPPPKRGNVARGLLASPAARQTTPRQLFSPYAKCSVQEKAKAFESQEAITPASTTKKTTQAQKRTKAAVAPEPVTPVPPAPEPKASTSEAAADIEVASPPPPTDRRVTRQTASGLGKRAASSSSAAASEGAGEEANLAPCTPELMQSPVKKRVTRSSVAALPASSPAGQDPGPSEQGKADDDSAITLLSSSPSVVGSSSSGDEEWVSPPTSPKRAKLAPIQQPRSALGAAKKDGGVPAGSNKAPAKGRQLAVAVRKLSANYSMFRSTNPGTPKHGATPKRAVTPSRLGRPVGASDKRPGSMKHIALDESKRHDLSSSSDVEQNRKQEILRQKIDSTKRDREQRLARVQAERKRREEQRLKNELQRQQQAEEKERERLKQRAAFHQRKQSERSLHADTLAAASKRKAESPLPSTSKKAIILKPVKPATPRAARNACPDAEAARLIFAQPSTSLSQKAKVNNSLQQQAMLNSLSQSLRSQASFLHSPERPQAASEAHTVTELVEASQEKPPTVLNATFAVSAADQSAQPLDQTFTMPAAAAPNEPKTPSPANATFVQPDGGPPKCNGYDITPHRSELPPEPNKEKDNYDIHDLNSGDETDDDEKPRKQVPLWAKAPSLNQLLVRQAEGNINGLELFGGMPLLHLDKIFKEKKRYFNKRTSSALWD